MEDFRDKVVVITGAGSGIGRALALALRAEGAVLALNDWNEEALLTTVEQCGQVGLWQQFDVSDRAAMEAFAGRVAADLGRVDLVINNAGLAPPRRLTEAQGLAEYERVIGVNMWGVIYGSLAFLPYLRQQPNAGLVNISSVFGLMGYPRQSPYCISKFAVRGFTETLRIESRGTGLYVACVHPGGIRTNIVRHMQGEAATDHQQLVSEFERAARTTPERAAAVILRGIRRRRQRILIGADARVIDWVTRLFPGSYEKILLRSWRADRPT